jgi:hypothetical protein
MLNIVKVIDNFMNNLHTEEITLFSFDEDGIERFIKDVNLIAPKCSITIIGFNGCRSIEVQHITIKEKKTIENGLTKYNPYHILRW